MILGIKADDVVRDFHDAYMKNEVEPHEFLESLGLSVRRCYASEGIEWGCVYLVTVPSINFSTVLHSVVVDTRNGSVKIYDPAKGRPGRKHYVYVSPELNYHPILRPYTGTLFDDDEVPFFGYVVELEIVSMRDTTTEAA